MIGCHIAEELIVPGSRMQPFEPDCPVTLAWAEHDVLFPARVYRDRAVAVVPGAEFFVLGDVGHIPMMDDPRLVAETIRGAARRSASPAPAQTG